MDIIKKTALIITLLSTTLSFAQHTERFLKLTKSLVAIDTTTYTYLYKNDSIKEKGLSISYKMPEYTYDKKYGKITKYYNNGAIKSEQELDSFGNILKSKFYNPDGTSWWKSETLEIDSNLENPQYYFTKEGHLLITTKVWEYKYGEETGILHLRGIGEISKGKKSGIWKIFDEYGRLEEEIDYK